MKSEKKELCKLFLVLVGCGVVFALLSATYEKVECSTPERSYMLPCVMHIFEIPQNMTTYGFPFAFATRTDGIRMVGCGSVVGTFSRLSFCIWRFLANVLIYIALLFPSFYLRYRATKERIAKLSGSYTGQRCPGHL